MPDRFQDLRAKLAERREAELALMATPADPALRLAALHRLALARLAYRDAALDGVPELLAALDEREDAG